MRNPRFWRNVGAAVIALGLVAAVGVFLLPAEIADHWAAGVAFTSGLMALIFGTLWTAWRNREARAEAGLRRGDGLLGRWRVDPQTWRDFLALNETISVNAFRPRRAVPADGVEIIVGRAAIMIDGRVLTLAESGIVGGGLTAWGGEWIIEKASYGAGPPPCIYLYVRAKGSGHATPVYANLVFPTSAAAPADVQRAVDHLTQRAAERDRMRAETAGR